jgi:hypothetical protein
MFSALREGEKDYQRRSEVRKAHKVASKRDEDMKRRGAAAGANLRKVAAQRGICQAACRGSAQSRL